jgi:hypothetical protein
MDMIVNNQYANIELTSPIYYTKDTTRHIQFPRQIGPNCAMKVNFITGVDQDTFGGILLYHLQRKKNDESDNQHVTDKSISTSIQLLMIWICKSDKLYSRVTLIEHDNAFVWDKDMLKKFYDVNDVEYDADSDPVKWFLNDSIILTTVCKTSYGGLEVEGIISGEENELSPRKPLWLDPNR